MPATTKTQPKLIKPNGDEIPLEACRFDAEVDISAAAGEGGAVPVKIAARSNQPIEHPWWGTLVHDMDGMETDKSVIPIDYCHDPCEVLGFGEKFTPEARSGLAIEGKLLPFQDGDRASEVIFKSRGGVPYQGSIFFDPYRLLLEQVGDGMTAPVNGYQLKGPALIARKWVLRGVAVCPYGTDADTETMFKFRGGREAGAAQHASFKDFQMSTALVKTAEEIAAEEKKAPEGAAAAEAAKTAGENKTVAPPGETKTDPPAGEATKEKPPATAGQQAAASRGAGNHAPGKLFLDAFGPQGGVWFAEGLSFEEAQGKFNAAAQNRIQAAEAENATLKGQLSALRGEPVAVSGGHAERTPAEMKAGELAAKGVTDNYARLAASIKIPGVKK